MSTPRSHPVGQVYRCLVCRAEVSVIRCGAGELAPRCCNQPMSLLPQRHRTYVCPVCGSEIMVLYLGPGPLAPVCCNEPMELGNLAA